MGSGKYAPKYEWKEVILNTWPYNLAHAIAYEDSSEVSDEEAERMNNLYIPYLFNLLSTATERERKVIELRFKDGLTLQQVGSEFNISRTKIAEIEAKALRKLRMKSRRLRIFIDIDQLNDWERLEEKAILLGIECQGLKFENEVIRSELWNRLQRYKGSPSIDDIIQARKKVLTGSHDHNEYYFSEGIDELELSVRAYNALKSGGSSDIKDLLYASVDDLVELRRSGRKSFDELLEKMGPHIPRPIEEVMRRFEKADKYRNKNRKHYYITDIGKEVTLKTPECSKQVEQYERITIDELELSCLPYNYLKRAGIDTVADLISLTKDEFLSIQGIGKITTEEIIEKTVKIGVPTESIIHLWQAAIEKDSDRSRYEVLPEGILIRGCYPGEPNRMVRMDTRLLL